MNRNILFVVVMCGTMLGCAPIAQMTCEPYGQPQPPCNPQQDPAAPQVTLNTITLKAKPFCVRAQPGSYVIFRLVPHDKNEIGSVEISPKGPEQTWPQAENGLIEDLIILTQKL